MLQNRRFVLPAVVVVVLALGVTALVGIFGGLFDDEALAEGEVSWLYSQNSSSGELEDLGDGRHRLVMRDVNPRTIQFSDRPDRLVEIIDTSRLVQNWDLLFNDSNGGAPNAVLVEHERDGTTDSLVLVLENPVYDMANRTLSYEVVILADELHPERLTKKVGQTHKQPPVAMRDLSLFIDSVQDAGGGPAIDPSLISGPGAQRLLDLLAGADLGGGVRLLSATVDTADDGSVTGSAVVSFSSGGFSMSMTLQLTDAQNWVLTASPGQTDPWSSPAVPSLVIDPSSFSGTISMSAGQVAYDLVGATHSWQTVDGGTYVSTPQFSLDCPLEASQCPTGIDGPFLSMNGSLTVPGIPIPVALNGAITTDAEWMRFDGVAGDVTFEGFAITAATITLWHGQRNDSYDPNLDLPSLAPLNSGVEVELCGGLTIPIPGYSSKATDGCARWSPSGVVIGQVGVDVTVSGSMPSTPQPVAATGEVMGAAWTNLSASAIGTLPSPDVIMSGVVTALETNTIVLAGKASLPGVVADALNVNLGGAQNLVFDITGRVSESGFSLTGQVPTNVSIGTEPFRIDIGSIGATITVEKGDVSFALGTAGTATVGYSPQTRQLATSVQLVAATAPAVGMALSVNATGTPAAVDAGRDGLSAATRLTDPAGAQYVWPDQFGIQGKNLWSLTVQIAFTDGSPALGYTSTAYLDPNGAQTGKVLSCQGPCDGADWMVGTMAFNVSYANPCFAYSFDSSSGTSGFSIDGGTIKATAFKVGIAPDGCSIQSGTTQQSLPVGFAGFQFTASFGSATLNVATQVSANGFVFNESITNLTLAGMKYKEVSLSITIDSSGSNVSFTADMTSGMGDMAVVSQFAGTSSGITQSLDATMTNWGWAGGGVDLPRFHFATSSTVPTTATGCARFTTAADGQIKLGGRTVTLAGANTTIDCNGVQDLYLSVYYDHKAKWNGATTTGHLELRYPTPKTTFTSTGPKTTNYLYGEVDYSYLRHFSKKYQGRTFSKNVEVAFGMSVTVNPKGTTSSGFAFWGSFDADRVSGSIGCDLPPDSTDFTCGGQLRLNPSWAGVYHHTWGDL